MDDRGYQLCKEQMYTDIVILVQEGQNEELMLNDLVRIRRCTDDFIDLHVRIFEDRIEAKRKESLA